MPFDQPVLALLAGLAIGLLIGIERGWVQREFGEGQRIAGVRTYALLGLLGGMVGVLSLRVGVPVLGVGVVAVTIVIVAAYVMDFRSGGDIGITSAVAALSTFVFAAAAGLGHTEVAGAAAVVMVLLLNLKPELHGWVERISRDELKAVFQLLLLSVVLLPILPDQDYGPWGALNPRTIWWLVVLVAGLSFVGYLAMRLVGAKRGILATGLFGGLASSTALTLHYSRLARRTDQLVPALAGGILLASATMPLRMLLIIAVIEWQLVPDLVLPLLAMGFVGAATAPWLARRSPRADTEGASALGNPVALRPALAFGAMLAIILLLTAAVRAWFGSLGVLAAAAVSGIANVDAITVSLARMGDGKTVAAAGIVLATATNSLAKAAATRAFGSRALARAAAPALVLTAAGGGLATAALLADRRVLPTTG